MLSNERKATVFKVNKVMSQNKYVIESNSVIDASINDIKNVNCITNCITFMPLFFFYVPYTIRSNF